MQFRIETFLNQYLAPNATRADAVFSVGAAGAAANSAESQARRLIGLIADKSGSMSGDKMDALKHALRVAVDQMDAGVEAFVIAFAGQPALILPRTRMDEAGRRAAHAAIQRLEASGGTLMSAALTMAQLEFREGPGALCQAIMLTDGQNDASDERRLDAALGECEGVFQADCRGVGTDWSPAQLRAIADRLLGTTELIARPEGLAEDFRATMAAAMSKSVAGVRLRLWMPKNARLVAVKQAFPTEIDLMGKLVPVDQRAVDVPLGAWGAGTQDYFATFELTPLGIGEQMLVCRPSIVWRDPAAGDQSAPGGNVTVTWTADAGLSTRIDAQVAHYTGQGEASVHALVGTDLGDDGRLRELRGQMAQALSAERAGQAGQALAAAPHLGGLLGTELDNVTFGMAERQAATDSFDRLLDARALMRAVQAQAAQEEQRSRSHATAAQRWLSASPGGGAAVFETLQGALDRTIGVNQSEFDRRVGSALGTARLMPFVTVGALVLTVLLATGGLWQRLREYR